MLGQNYPEEAIKSLEWIFDYEDDFSNRNIYRHVMTYIAGTVQDFSIFVFQFYKLLIVYIILLACHDTFQRLSKLYRMTKDKRSSSGLRNRYFARSDARKTK